MNTLLSPSAQVIAPIANGIITVLIAMMFILGLLIVRQARQMTNVLPSPVSPYINIMAYTYTLLAFIAVIIAIGTFITF